MAKQIEKHFFPISSLCTLQRPYTNPPSAVCLPIQRQLPFFVSPSINLFCMVWLCGMVYYGSQLPRCLYARNPLQRLLWRWRQSQLHDLRSRKLYRADSSSSHLGFENPPVPVLTPISGLEISPTPTLENSSPKETLYMAAFHSVLCCFQSKQRQPPSVSFPIHVLCEVCCVAWLCGIPWLQTAGIAG